MKIKDLKPTDYHIYVDLDGVMADLEKKMLEVTGHQIQNKENDRGNPEDDQNWKKFHDEIAAGRPLFAEMDMMPDAQKLWDYIKKYKPHILTATGKRNVLSVDKQKREWVQEHLPEHNTVYTVTGSKNKAKFAWPDSVLIDDRMKSIDPWREKGGIGIHHTSAKETIAQLKKLGL